MSYFRKFPTQLYQFANGDRAIMQNLSAYVDIIDQVKENSAFYIDYYIRDGDRPDNVAYTLYENPQLHWTFFIMNDSIREKGWPLTREAIVKKAIEDHPNTTLNTRDDIDTFLKDSIVESSSGAKGRVVRIDTGLGQIVIDVLEGKFSTDDIVSNGSQNVTLLSVEAEYLSTRFYKNSDGEKIDYRTKDGWNTTGHPVTHIDHYTKENESLRQIRVIQPRSITAVVGMFNKAIQS